MTLRAPTMALLLTVAAPALAQSEPRFCPNRPSLGTSTCTTDPGRVLAEVSGVDWQRSPEDGGKAESTLFGDLQLRTGTVGTVSMDMLAIDLTPCPQAGIGSPVELWGNEVKIDDVAAAAGTVGYELMCALAPRVPVVTV